MLNKSARIAAGACAGYFALVPLLFAAVNLGLPMWLERLLLALAAPGVLSVLPWLPLLRRLGWSEGEWLIGPSPWAYALLALAYSLVAALFAHLWPKLRR